MRPTTLAPLLASLLVGFTAAAAHGQSEEEAVRQEELLDASSKLRLGEYEVALRNLSDTLEADPKFLPAHLLRLRGLLAYAQWEAVEPAAKALVALDEKQPLAHLALAVLAARRGEYAEAAGLAQKAYGSNLDRTARVAVAQWLADQDQMDAAKDAAQKVVEAGASETLSRRETISLGKAYELIGSLREASECFVRIVPSPDTKKLPALAGEDLLDPLLPFDACTALGDLYFTVYRETAGRPGAEKEYRFALDKNPYHLGANLGRYRIGKSNFQLNGEVTERCLRRVLELDPNHPTALSLQAEQRIHDRRFADGEAIVRKILALNPRHLQARADLAALDYLQNRTESFQTAFEGDRKANPKSSRFPATLGAHLKALYRFADASPYLQEAIARDPKDAESMTALGECLAHTGKEKEALEMLRRADESEPGFAHPWRTNMIQALAVLEDQYVETSTEHFRLKMSPDLEPVLKETLAPFYEATRSSYGERYGYVPKGPVQVKVFTLFDDFSARTIGFTGFGALGVCFGELITSVSPVTVPFRGNFSYLDTAWHEYAHVVHLGISKGRVPRWFTEGLATLEEVKRNPGFDRHMELDLLEARHTQQIYPILELNSAFRGPRIIFGYYQGGLLCEMLEKRSSTAKFVEALELFGKDLPLDEVLKRAFGMTGEEIDKEFLAFVDKKLEKVRVRPRLDEKTIGKLKTQITKNPKDLAALHSLGWAFARRGNLIEADGVLVKLRAAAPDDADASLIRAEVARQRDRLDLAEEHYAKGFAGGAEEFFARCNYSAILAQKKDYKNLKIQLEAAIAAFPTFANEMQSPAVRLAALLESDGEVEKSTKVLEDFCKVSGEARMARLVLAARYEQASDFASLDRVLHELLEVEPFDRRTLQRRAKVLLELGKFEEAAAHGRWSSEVKITLDRRPTPQERTPDLTSMIKPPKPELDPEAMMRKPPVADSDEDRAERAEGKALEAQGLWKAGKREEAASALKRALSFQEDNARALELKAQMESSGK